MLENCSEKEIVRILLARFEEWNSAVTPVISTKNGSG